MKERRILFCLGSLWFFRNFAPVVERLAERGHAVRIVLLRPDEEPSARRRLDSILARFPNVIVELMPERSDFWAALGHFLGKALDYLYFHRPRFDEKPVLRVRASARTHPAIRWLLARLSRPGRTGFAFDALHRLERLLPLDRRIARAFAPGSADVAVFSPLIDVGLRQYDHLRAARAARIPTVLAVHSWDNLSSKPLIREMPDRVLAWNERQLEEAESFHAVPRQRMFATGAPGYDHWFASQPSRPREAFLRQLGLDPGRPTLLYLCSAIFGFREPPEPAFFRRWVEAVRSAGDLRLADANIIARPHPRRAGDWAGGAAAGLGPGVVLYPAVAENPADAKSIASFTDCLHHCDAVMAINTTAIIEAAILGKPVLTVLDPAYRDSQEGTFHFAYLTGREGQPALLRTAPDFATHLAQLAQALSRDDEARDRERAFAVSFVRPQPDREATELFADAAESACDIVSEPVAPGPRWHPAAQILLAPLALAVGIGRAFARPASLLGRGPRRGAP